MADNQVHLRNPNIKDDKEDVMYHLGLTYHPSDPYLAEQFGDVRFVLMGGSAERAKRFAVRAARELGMEPPMGYGLRAIGKQERFSLYKARAAEPPSPHARRRPSRSQPLTRWAPCSAYRTEWAFPASPSCCTR